MVAIAPAAPLSGDKPMNTHHLALDGLRGVAILMVLVFHAALTCHWDRTQVLFGQSGFHIPGWVFGKTFKLGWFGVDFFFVLSGFLITGILLDTRNSKNHFRVFYIRRIIRIIPVYYLFLAFFFVLIPLLYTNPYDTPEMKAIQDRQGWMWAHLTNIGFIFHKKAYAEQGWLSLNHLWSLAIEEQFYLFWPFIVFFVSRAKLKWICVIMIVTSLLFRIGIWMAGLRNGAIYFPTPCRLDGLATGALIALFYRDPSFMRVKPAIVWSIGALLLVSLIAFAAVRGKMLDFEDKWMLDFRDKPTVVFGVTLVSLFAGVLVFVCTHPVMNPNPLRSFFSLEPLRFIGKYSYGMYLFHAAIQPPLAIVMPPQLIVEHVGSQFWGNLIYLFIFYSITISLALISWHFYEKHWLKLKKFAEYK